MYLTSLLFQAKDDQEKWAELKEQLIQYERRRIEIVSYFEAVRHAQQVQVDEIPLPSAASDISMIYAGEYNKYYFYTWYIL